MDYGHFVTGSLGRALRRGNRIEERPRPKQRVNTRLLHFTQYRYTLGGIFFDEDSHLWVVEIATSA
jgi:hypothetical protein